ncbi:MAG: DNA polymerase III subunit chi [Gammaproteobacteria bacterium]
MTKVDFYLLENENRNGLLRFACQLTEKIYGLGHRVHLHTGNSQIAERLDQLLWTFSELAFLPHERVSSEQLTEPAPAAPITIGTAGDASDPLFCEDVLINLSDEVPLWFSRFARVAEFVAGDDQDRTSARERYRFYRDRGYNLDTHQINS